MLLAAMLSTARVNGSIISSADLSICGNSALQSSLKRDQSARCNCHLDTLSVVRERQGTRTSGKWSLPQVVLWEVHLKSRNRAGWQIERSMEVREPVAGCKYVGRLSFQRQSWLLEMKFSIISPRESVESPPHKTL